jgi:hypothetical protein
MYIYESPRKSLRNVPSRDNETYTSRKTTSPIRKAKPGAGSKKQNSSVTGAEALAMVTKMGRQNVKKLFSEDKENSGVASRPTRPMECAVGWQVSSKNLKIPKQITPKNSRIPLQELQINGFVGQQSKGDAALSVEVVVMVFTIQADSDVKEHRGSNALERCCSTNGKRAKNRKTVRRGYGNRDRVECELHSLRLGCHVRYPTLNSDSKHDEFVSHILIPLLHQKINYTFLYKILYWIGYMLFSSLFNNHVMTVDRIFLARYWGCQQ